MAKCLKLSELPMVLVLTLKRYSYGMYGKISRSVSFGEVLDLSDCYEPAVATAGATEGAAKEGTAEEGAKGEAASGTAAKVAAAAEEETTEGAAEEVAGAAAAPNSRDAPPSRWAKYRLCGVLVHHDVMNSCFYGHYVAYVRSGDSWLLMDDDDVTEISWDKVASTKAYMLFYQKIPQPPPGQPINEVAATVEAAAADDASASGAGQSKAGPSDVGPSGADPSGAAGSSSGGALSSPSRAREATAGSAPSSPQPAPPHPPQPRTPEKAAGEDLAASAGGASASCASDGATTDSTTDCSSNAAHNASDVTDPADADTADAAQPTGAVPPTAALTPSIAGTGMLADLAASVSPKEGAAVDATTAGTMRAAAKEEKKASTGKAAEGGGAGGGRREAPEARTRGKEAKSAARGDAKSDGNRLSVPDYSLETIDGAAALFDGAPYFDLKVHLPRCESILYPGCGGKVSDYKYCFKAPGHYLPLELSWPSRVDEKRAKCKFLKSKRILCIQVPKGGSH